MDEEKQRDMAMQLCARSKQFEFDIALELVQMQPAKAQEILDMYAEMERRQEERVRGRERRKRALIEDYG